jgi:hypothetical protein
MIVGHLGGRDMWLTRLTAPRARSATVAIGVVVAIAVLLMFYLWVTGTQLRPMP